MKGTWRPEIGLPTTEEMAKALSDGHGQPIKISSPDGEVYVALGVPLAYFAAASTASAMAEPTPVKLPDRLRQSGRGDVADLIRLLGNRLGDARRFDLAPIPPPPNNLQTTIADLEQAASSGDETAREAAARIHQLQAAIDSIGNARNERARPWAVTRQSTKAGDAIAAIPPEVPESKIHVVPQAIEAAIETAIQPTARRAGRPRSEESLL